jgi:ABC-2 type transport system ATP-binding protein
MHVPAIEAVDLHRSFEDIEAVAGVTFEVSAGETFGFLGPNGAGKSTTIAVLCTLLLPTSGTARVAGFDVVKQATEVRRRIGLVFQEPTLDEYLTALENLRFHAELYGVPRSQREPRVERVLRMVGLWDRRGHLVRTFSGGMKRRLEIARGLLHSPRVLFLDEPTVGLDPQTRSHIWNYINELKRQEATTMFLTTHYMDEAEFADRIAIIDEGKLVASGTPETLKAGVGQDRVTIKTGDDRAAIEALEKQFGLQPKATDEGITFQVAAGEEFVPRLFGELGIPITSVNIARPSLDDVFMNYTGRTIRDAEASTLDKRRSNPFLRSRR